MREALEEEPNLRIVQAEVAAPAISAMILPSALEKLAHTGLAGRGQVRRLLIRLTSRRAAHAFSRN